MAKFPTEVEQSITVQAQLVPVYQYLWSVVKTSRQIPGLESCKRVAKDTYRFTYDEKSRGPVTLVVCYTAQYAGNGTDLISYEGLAAVEDNTDVRGSFRLQRRGAGATQITLQQMLAPEVPIPRLLQGLVRPLVEREQAYGVRQYLANVKRVLEGGS
jgi:hypothetical protein